MDQRGADQRGLEVDEEDPLIKGTEEYDDAQRRMGGVSEVEPSSSLLLSSLELSVTTIYEP